MKLLQSLLIALVFLVNLLLAQPSWADAPKLTKTPEYAQVVQSLNEFLELKENPNDSVFTAEEIERNIGELKLQKYILETARHWGQCSNETGKNLGVYAQKPKQATPAVPLYFLANGETTDYEWNCEGIYFPSGIKVSGLNQGQELTEPLAIKIVPGTQLVAKTNTETGEIELNISPAQIFKSGEGSWTIPNFSQVDIDAQVPNAPSND